MKKMMIALAALTIGVSAWFIPTQAHAETDAVLMVVPARYTVMQVAFDVARRYPSVLVSYQGADPDPRLYVWNGFEWLPLPVSDYQSGAFLQSFPSRTLFLGDDSLLPASLRSIQSWCSQSKQFPDLETPALVNAIGQYLPFTPADWRWFAGRYNLTLTDTRADEQEKLDKETWYSGSAPVKDPPPSFFKYFTRSRRSETTANASHLTPVEMDPDEVVTPAAAPVDAP